MPDEDACAVVNTGEEIGVSVGVDVFVPNTGTCTGTLPLPFSLVTPFDIMAFSISRCFLAVPMDKARCNLGESQEAR